MVFLFRLGVFKSIKGSEHGNEAFQLIIIPVGDPFIEGVLFLIKGVGRRLHS